MSCLTPPTIRLPLRIQSLVSLTSILIRIQPIASLQSAHRPFSSLQSASTRPPTSSHAHNHHTPAAGGGKQKGGSSLNCRIRSGTDSNHPISSQYMCGNSYSSMASSNPAVVQPTGTHTATVIFLHGLGDQGYGWAESFGMIKESHIKYIFPHAEIMPVTLNMGMNMPSWFDIISLGVGGKEDEPGIKTASQKLQDMIVEEESKGISPERIIIGGFSQGGAVALYTALTRDKPLAGVLGLSTWMPLSKSFNREGFNRKQFPLLQCHGKADQLLPYTLGELTHNFLKATVVNPEFKGFEGLAHSSSMEEMACVKEFLKKTVP